MNCTCASKTCSMKKNPKCCWCTDKRTNKEKKLLYLDGYGKVDLTYLGVEIPIDIHYCPSCKLTKMTVNELVYMFTESLQNTIENENKRKIKSIYRKIHR